jgi:uncharacterized membrane protein required for colicin V production
MNFVDLAIIAVWAVSAIWGYSQGLLNLAVPFIALLIGIPVASRFGESAGLLFSGLDLSENAEAVAGMLLVLAVVVIIGIVLGQLLRKVLAFIPLGGMVNSASGLALGLVIAFAVLSAVLTGLQKYPFAGSDEKIEESALGPFLADNFDVVIRGVGLIPGDWDETTGGLFE